MTEVIVWVEAVVEQDAEAVRRGLTDCNADKAIGGSGILSQSGARLGVCKQAGENEWVLNRCYGQVRQNGDFTGLQGVGEELVEQ